MSKAMIVYCNATCVTGRELSKYLDIHGRLKFRGHKELKILICWGCKEHNFAVEIPDDVVVLNPVSKIGINRDKLGALKLMQETGVSIPTLNPTLYPQVGRSRYHQGGVGFWYCPHRTAKNKAIHEGAQYFQRYIKVATEYRVHVFRDRIIKCQIKVPADDQKTNTVIHSLKHGWWLLPKPVSKMPKCVKDEARKAVRAIGLDFGAVDICMDAKKKPYVFEVNTAPGLDGSTFNRYIDVFTEIIWDIAKE